MHQDENNPEFKYLMHGHEPSKIEQDKDLGVIIIKGIDQCPAESRKVNIMSGIILGNIII